MSDAVDPAAHLLLEHIRTRGKPASTPDYLASLPLDNSSDPGTLEIRVPPKSRKSPRDQVNQWIHSLIRAAVAREKSEPSKPQATEGPCPVCGLDIYQCEHCGGMGCEQCANGKLPRMRYFLMVDTTLPISLALSLSASNASDE